jgi:streptogramin lyase
VGDTVRLDVGPGGGDGPGPSGPCSCGEHDWSYVFIANSQQGTVSKVNTRTLAEEGRYLTRPDGAGNPSRTSVSVDGMAVAVANRHTGITKIWSRTEFCDPDTNGVPGLQTSSGKNDVLPWGEDDCVAWHTAFNTTLGMSVQRPVQWTPGTPNALGCNEDQKIWTVTGSGGHSEGLCGPNGVWVHLLDGDTGAVEQSIHLPENEFNCDHTNTGQGIGLGAYGGAVDSHGNFWFHGWGNSKLVRVDVATLAYEIFDSSSGYGITVDTKGRPWFGFPQRFDYATKTWAQPSGGGGSDNGGLAQDLQGRMWTSDGEAGVRWYDVETMDLGDNVSLPGTGVVKGVSVDVDGYIWAVRFGDTRAYKIDPDTYQLEYYEGLDGPYTYSDMTGGALVNVACNPEG